MSNSVSRRLCGQIFAKIFRSFADVIAFIRFIWETFKSASELIRTVVYRSLRHVQTFSRASSKFLAPNSRSYSTHASYARRSNTLPVYPIRKLGYASRSTTPRVMPHRWKVSSTFFCIIRGNKYGEVRARDPNGPSRISRRKAKKG